MKFRVLIATLAIAVAGLTSCTSTTDSSQGGAPSHATATPLSQHAKNAQAKKAKQAAERLAKVRHQQRAAARAARAKARLAVEVAAKKAQERKAQLASALQVQKAAAEARAKAQARSQTHACTQTSSGSCIQGGEFCKQSAYDQSGYDADGTRYVCKGDTTHPHWEVP
jgi:membrane protein involved in colicin uptake